MNKTSEKANRPNKSGFLGSASMMTLQELFRVLDIISLVVFSVAEDHQHTVAVEVVHIAP